MQSAGFIATYIRWRDWKELPFNIALFIFQIVFMVVGKILGKVKVKWRQIWKAAQCSHVRLCLGRDLDFLPILASSNSYFYMNFGWKFAKIETWRMDMIDDSNGRFVYRDPAFKPSPQFIEAMIQYARDQEGKRYDWLQLILGYPVNFVMWLFCPWLWGKEVIKIFNRPGGREVCSSGWLACLRWAYMIRYGYSPESANKMLSEGFAEYGTIFFEGYDTAVVPPCLAVIDGNWIIKHREVK